MASLNQRARLIKACGSSQPETGTERAISSARQYRYEVSLQRVCLAVTDLLEDEVKTTQRNSTTDLLPMLLEHIIMLCTLCFHVFMDVTSLLTKVIAMASRYCGYI